MAMHHPVPAAQDDRALLSDYLAVCNRAIAAHKDRFWLGRLLRLNRRLFGGASFPMLVYGDDPARVEGPFFVHYDGERQRAELVDEPPGRVAFSVKAPRAHLEEVAHRRPMRYVADPLAMDRDWIARRLRDEIGPGRALLLGALVGVAVGAIAWRRARRRGEGQAASGIAVSTRRTQ